MVLIVWLHRQRRCAQRGLLQRLRRRPRPDPGRRALEPAAADPAAAEGRQAATPSSASTASCPAASTAASSSTPTRSTTRDSDGDKQTTYIHYTLGDDPAPGHRPPTCRSSICQRRVGFRFMDSARRTSSASASASSTNRRPSTSATRSSSARSDDMNRARQVLSPSFLVWLDATLARGLRVRALRRRASCCNVKGHKKTAAELDALCQASAARRPGGSPRRPTS